MADQNLEKRLNTGTAQASSLDDKMDPKDEHTGLFESWGRFSGWDWTKIAGTAAASYYLISQFMEPATALLNVSSVMASYIIAAKLVEGKELTSNKLHSEMQAANGVSFVQSAAYTAIASITSAYKYLAAVLAIPPLVYTYSFLVDIVRKYNFTDLMKNFPTAIKEGFQHANRNFFPLIKKLSKWSFLPTLGIISFVPLRYQVATNAMWRPVSRYNIRGEEKRVEAEHKEKQEQNLEQNLQPSYG